MSIKHKISLYAGILLSVALIGFWALLQYKLLQSFKSQIDSFGEILSKQVADSVTELVLANDLLGLNVVLGQLNNETGVQSATITDVDGQVIASTLPPDSPAPTSGNLYIAPITVQEAVAGRLILVFDDNIISDPFGQSNLLFLGAWIAALAVALGLSWRLGNQIVRPLLELVDAVDAANADEEFVEIEISDFAEIGLLQQRVAETLTAQQQLKDELSVTGIPFEDDESQQVQRPERRMATLIAIEVVNSTPAIELLHPATFSTLLQQYQFYLRQVARLYRGTVTQLSGDRAVLSFDVRQCQDEHAFNALCCAQLFLLLSQKLAASQKAKNAQALEFKLTVHSGDVFFSLPWRKNKGEPDPMRTETMVGRSFTLAQDLLAHAHTGEILVSEPAYDLANGPQRFPDAAERDIEKDGLDLLGYILPVDSGTHYELLLKQCAHLMPEQQAKAGPA